jgi:CBS domain-containing protein
MIVADILAKKGSQVFSISPDGLVSEALHLLNKKRIGSLLVLDAEQNIKGIITERDILNMYAKAKGSVKNKKVKDIMTPAKKLIIGEKNSDLEYIMGIMTENRIRHLPIICEKGKLAGFISIGDIIKGMIVKIEHEKKMLSDYIEGKYPA